MAGTATLDPAEVAVAAYWVDQAASSSGSLAERTAAQMTALWMAFEGWYSAAAVAEVAEASAELSRTAQELAFDSMVEYIAQATSLAEGAGRLVIPQVRLPEIRGGVDLAEVYERPAKAFRAAVAEGRSQEQASQAAYDRVIDLVDTDLILARREGQRSAMRGLKVRTYRRVIRPELSATGTCLLCVAASLETYSVEDLMPIHNRCKCLTLPIVDGKDPGDRLNEADRQAIYNAAGVTNRQDLSNLRVQVQEHGELGPVLTVAGQKFTGPKALARKGKGKKSGSATDVDTTRSLDQLTSTLAELEESAKKFTSPGIEARIADLRKQIAARQGR